MPIRAYSSNSSISWPRAASTRPSRPPSSDCQVTSTTRRSTPAVSEATQSMIRTRAGSRSRGRGPGSVPCGSVVTRSSASGAVGAITERRRPRSGPSVVVIVIVVIIVVVEVVVAGRGFGRCDRPRGLPAAPVHVVGDRGRRVDDALVAALAGGGAPGGGAGGGLGRLSDDNLAGRARFRVGAAGAPGHGCGHRQNGAGRPDQGEAVQRSHGTSIPDRPQAKMKRR